MQRAAGRRPSGRGEGEASEAWEALRSLSGLVDRPEVGWGSVRERWGGTAWEATQAPPLRSPELPALLALETPRRNAPHLITAWQLTASPAHRVDPRGRSAIPTAMSKHLIFYTLIAYFALTFYVYSSSNECSSYLRHASERSKGSQSS